MSKTVKQNSRSGSTGRVSPKRVWKKIFRQKCFGRWNTSLDPHKCVECQDYKRCLSESIRDLKRKMLQQQNTKLRTSNKLLNLTRKEYESKMKELLADPKVKQMISKTNKQ